MDANGVLAAIYDASTSSLRISATNDAIFFTAGQIQSAATVITTNDVPRFQFPDAATTSAWVTFIVPNTWSQANVGFTWCGSAAGTAPVRWRLAVKKLDTFVDNISEAFFADVSANVATPAAAGVTVNTNNQIASMNVTAAAFGTLYSALIQRVGADAGDTYLGVAELIAINLQRV